MPDTVIKTWQSIWTYFSDKPTYQRNFKADFEHYSGANRVQIYIGVNE